MQRPGATFLLSLFTFLFIATLVWLTVGVPLVFTSPDENANFFFATTFMGTGDFAFPDTVNVPLAGAVHPRSVIALGVNYLPGSFVGWPFFAGLFGILVGVYGVLLLTPFLAVLGILMWWDIARMLTGNRRFATIAAVLLALHPAFWYYAARGMMHNVPFLVALIAAVWFAFHAIRHTPYASPEISRLKSGVFASALGFGAAGLCIGAALFIRTSESLWVLALTAVFMVMWWKEKAKSEKRKVSASLFALVVGIAAVLGVMAAWNAHLYGGPFVIGYTVDDGDVAASDTVRVADGGRSFVDEIGSALLPFGFHPRAILKNVWNYGLALFPWMTVLAMAGILASMIQWRKMKSEKSTDPWRILAWVTLGLAVWLGIMYGSWSFNDNPDPSAITIGDSHVRYWLPLFALSTLFAARAIVKMFQADPDPALPEDMRRETLAHITLASIAILSAVLVFGGQDGLLRTRDVLFESAAKRNGVIAATEEDALIVVDRADKFLFPYRRVIQPLRDEKTYAALPDAVDLAPLYYYGIPFPTSDLAYLNDVKLAGLGLRIDAIELIGDEMLYRITKAAE